MAETGFISRKNVIFGNMTDGLHADDVIDPEVPEIRDADTLGGRITAADFDRLNENLVGNNTIASVTSDGSTTLRNILNQLYGLITVPKSHNLKLTIERTNGNTDVFVVSVISSTSIMFSRSGLNTTGNSQYIGVVEIASSNSKYFSIVNGTINDYSTSLETDGTLFKISY